MERYQQVRHALGSEAFVTLVTDQGASADECFALVWAKVEEFEARFSRFRVESELSQLNAAAGRRVSISPELLALLMTSKTLSEKTEGVFNPFILPALNQAGYIGSWPQTDEFEQQLDYRDRHKQMPIAALELGEYWARIPVDTAIDLGGIGKGYLLDEIGGYLRAKTFTNFWVSLGGDVLCSGFDLDGKPWSIAVQRANQQSTPVTVVTNEGGKMLGVATSGTTKRKGEHAGRQWHHIIDPRTGMPAKTDLLTATITASTATEADVYAKCAIILGLSGAGQLLAVSHVESLVLQPIEGVPRLLVAHPGVAA